MIDIEMITSIFKSTLYYLIPVSLMFLGYSFSKPFSKSRNKFYKKTVLSLGLLGIFFIIFPNYMSLVLSYLLLIFKYKKLNFMQVIFPLIVSVAPLFILLFVKKWKKKILFLILFLGFLIYELLSNDFFLTLVRRKNEGSRYYIVIAFSLFFGPLLRRVFTEIFKKKAKGRVIENANEFYLGKDNFLADKLQFGVNNNVIKSCILTQHHLILGMSGAGKTFSTLHPLVYYNIKWRNRLFIIDPKGDVDFSNYAYSCAVKFNRKEDYFFFSMSSPQHSHGFNPLKGLTSNEVKDLIISCTEWSEPYYKKMAEVELLNILENVRVPTITEIFKRIPNEDYLLGLKADLEIMAKSDYGKLIDNCDAPSIEELHQENRICFFSINKQAYPEAAPQIGRIILGALMALSNKVQSHSNESERHETRIIIDEFGSFLTPTFIDFLNKARSSKMRLSLATQSLGDIELDGSGKTRKQIADSTTVKVFMRVSDAESAEWCSKTVGTQDVIKRTVRVDQRNLIKDTLTGSERDTKEYIAHPDQIKGLKDGQGIVYTQSPLSVSLVSFDSHKKITLKIYDYLKDKKLKKNKDIESEINREEKEDRVDTLYESI